MTKTYRFNLHTLSIMFTFLCLAMPSLADSANFDSNTSLLEIPSVIIDNGPTFRNVKIKLNVANGIFTIQSLNAALALTASDFCVDSYSQGACSILGRDDGESEFVLESKCNSSFPQQIFLGELYEDILCSNITRSACGACGFSIGNTVVKREQMLIKALLTTTFMTVF